jgi:hypothetical protein
MAFFVPDRVEVIQKRPVRPTRAMTFLTGLGFPLQKESEDV